MTNQRRPSQTQMASINAQMQNQNQTLRNMIKVGNQTNVITNDIQSQLNRQKEVLVNSLEKNNEIKKEVKRADKQTNKMRRRNFCMKGMLWILAILLFAINIGLIIWKATASSG